DKMGACGLSTHPGLPQSLDRLAVVLLGVRSRACQRSTAGREAERPGCVAGVRARAETIQCARRDLRVTRTRGRLDELRQADVGEPKLVALTGPAGRGFRLSVVAKTVVQ